MSALLVVIPCLNEAAHLPALLETLCADPGAASARIVVCDGGSTDTSTQIVAARAAADPRIVLLSNPDRIQSAGVNLAVNRFGADTEFFVRIDAHAGYPGNFLSELIEAQRASGADSVTVSMRATAADGACFQQAAAVAQNSTLGSGGSGHRRGGARRFVDHGHHALFRTRAFLSTGGYDETFSHNEDAEFDARLIGQGGKILLAADILIDYAPRRTLPALARQYFMYGQGRARTLLLHRSRPKLRQLAPVTVAPAAALALLAPFSPWFAAPFAAWAALCLIYGAALGLRDRKWCAGASGLAAATMHLCWSAGFIGCLAARPAAPTHKRALRAGA